MLKYLQLALRVFYPVCIFARSPSAQRMLTTFNGALTVFFKLVLRPSVSSNYLNLPDIAHFHGQTPGKECKFVRFAASVGAQLQAYLFCSIKRPGLVASNSNFAIAPLAIFAKLSLFSARYLEILGIR